MNRSFSLCKIFGITIQVHWLFLVLLAVLLWTYGVPGVIFTCLIFCFVIFHELGHSLTARRFGINVRKITLLPIGGMAHLEGEIPSPKAEMWIAAAGPLVSLGFAALFYLLAILSGTGGVFFKISGLDSLTEYLSLIYSVNFMLAIFNLIPAFPMDGGRILRAILAIKKGMGPATITAVKIGGFAAIIMGIVGIILNELFLVFIAAFIFFAGKKEELATRMRYNQMGIDPLEILRRMGQAQRNSNPTNRNTSNSNPREFYEGCEPIEPNSEDPISKARSFFDQQKRQS